MLNKLYLLSMMLSKAMVATCATACTAVLWKNEFLIAAEPVPTYQLCQVQVVFRHGARTPVFCPEYLPAVSYEQGLMNHSSKTHVNYRIVSLVDDIPPHSFIEEFYAKRGFLKGGCLPGQLTRVGADQTYQLGRYLRRRYVEDQPFLSTSFSSLRNEVYTRSTNMARTVMSARSVLAGLFGEYGEKPLDIHVAHGEDEILYPNFGSCPMLKKLCKWAWDEPDKLPGNIESREAIAKALSLPVDTELNHVDVRDNFAAEEAHGKDSLKRKLNAEMFKTLEDGAMKMLQSAFIGTQEVRDQSLKLSIGPLVDVLLKNMEDFAEGQKPSEVKISLYSGHDTTLLPLLSSIGIDCSTWPPYAANVIFELYRKNEGRKVEYFVKVLYNGQEQYISHQRSTMCPLDIFIKSMDSVRVSRQEYAKLCRSCE